MGFLDKLLGKFTPSTRQPMHAKYISGLTAMPRTFDCVKKVVIEADRINLFSDRGPSVSTPVNTGFLDGAD